MVWESGKSGSEQRGEKKHKREKGKNTEKSVTVITEKSITVSAIERADRCDA
jgi:hypothetical protein